VHDQQVFALDRVARHQSGRASGLLLILSRTSAQAFLIRSLSAGRRRLRHRGFRSTNAPRLDRKSPDVQVCADCCHRLRIEPHVGRFEAVIPGQEGALTGAGPSCPRDPPSARPTGWPFAWCGRVLVNSICPNRPAKPSGGFVMKPETSERHRARDQTSTRGCSLNVVSPGGLPFWIAAPIRYPRMVVERDRGAAH
jgi:hypothetical protein